DHLASYRAGTALPLPLAGEGWGGGVAAIHSGRVERVAPTRIASFDAIRPPPQAGEARSADRQPIQLNTRDGLTITAPAISPASSRAHSRSAPSRRPKPHA